MLTTTVDNFPGFPEGIQGPDLMVAMRKQAERFGTEFITVNVSGVDLDKKPFEISAGGTVYLAKTIIATTGANVVWLDAPGVNKLIGRGVSSCAPCDAPFFKDKKVAVVGGGDSAMEEASTLAKYASEVTIIHRRDAFRATPAMQQKVLNHPKIKIMWNSEIVAAKGEQKLASLVIKNNKDNTQTEIAFDGLFVAIGHKPESDLFKGRLDMNERGFIKKSYREYHSQTNVPGVFVAGDVTDAQYKQAVTAAGMGCTAGMDAIKFLEETKNS
jgi:thioredoxin reductase (NADPH)